MGRGLALLAAILLAGGCAPVASEGAAHRPRIVSLNPCLDAILVAVTPPDQVLALSHYSRDPGSSSIPPAVAARYPVTGGTAEEIIALAPDLVLASSFLPQPTRTALERAGLRVEAFGSPASLAESIAQVREVAQLAGAVDEGEALVAAMARAAAPVAPGDPVDTLLWQPGEIVAGEATLVAELLRAKGFVSHAAAMGFGQGDHVALETVLARPPALLLVAGDSAGQRHPVLHQLARTQVVPLAPNYLFCGGPTVIALGKRLDQLRAELRR
ncbi:ABC transporter substrate-binding protein [Erythrobacter tepidarius]|uniref:ABC transporter substrate-binding protein n=1 Tax=Erythrobacter tepidarius TaxID=60454 RepID=UPI000A380490|nr:ABC transporter substrate-binding protein [Erythrobacter tepidarius]